MGCVGVTTFSIKLKFLFILYSLLLSPFKMQRQHILLFLYWFGSFISSNAQIPVEQPVFTWPGPITVPVDFPYFEDRRVRIQLSNNDTNIRELRIREGVIVTFDCTARLNETIAQLTEAGISPASVLRGITWYAHFINVNGELIGSEIVVTIPRIGTGTIIYSLNGTYNELLTADGSDVPSAAKRGGSGTYRCEVCYNTSGSAFQCNSTTVINNVIGDPPVVIVGTEDDVSENSQGYNAVFGVDYCIENSSSNLRIIVMTCSHNTSFPVKPTPVASYFRNGVPIVTGGNSIYGIDADARLVGGSNRLTILIDPARFDQVLGNYTCTLTNLFGNSTTTTEITQCCKPPDFPNIISTSNTFIQNPNDGGLIIGTSTCFTGISFSLACDPNTTESRTIMWKRNGVKVDENDGETSISIQRAGDYTCCVRTRCGLESVTSRILSAPTINTGSGNVTSSSILIGQNTCTSGPVNITCQSNSPSSSISWVSLADTSTVLGTSPVLTVTAPGTYRCTASNQCGLSIALSTVRRSSLRLSITTSLSGSGGDCSRLKIPPTGVDLCPFVGDSLSLVCVTDSSSILGTLTPPGSTNTLSVRSVSTSQNGRYVCSASDNICGAVQTSLTVQVFDPARISRTFTIPSSTNTTVVIGAGRSNSSITIGNGQSVNLHCPYTGTERPSVQWYRLVGGTLVRVSGNETGLSLSDTNNNLILTIGSYNSSFSGTYFCNASNNAGDDSAGVTLETAIISGTWIVSEWTECSLSCGGGIRTRTVTCISRTTSQPLDFSNCDPLLMPSTVEYCNLSPCCDKDLYPYCRYIAGTDRCNKQEFKDVCCCTCN